MGKVRDKSVDVIWVIRISADDSSQKVVIKLSSKLLIRWYN